MNELNWPFTRPNRSSNFMRLRLISSTKDRIERRSSRISRRSGSVNFARPTGEPEEDVLMDVLDSLVDRCSPHVRETARISVRRQDPRRQITAAKVVIH